MSEVEVDIRGMVCPVPVIELKKAGDKQESGDKLRIIMSVDGKTNVEGWAKGNGYLITDFVKNDDKAVFMLVKGEANE
ncbi:MAG: sulfurtransferase TusA family protein [Candidatus Altiarchaeota archaeon]